MTQTSKLISICIPVFNEAANLPIAVAAVEEVFKKELPGYRLEIIVTDNASTDHTWQVAQELASARSNLRAFRFSRNFGYQASIFAGLSLAKGDAVIELDADLEDPPRVIPEFVRKWEEGYQVAYGVRATRQAPLLMKLVFSSFYKLLNRLSDLDIPENSGDFRLMDRQVVDILKALPERNLYLRGLVSYLGFRQAKVVYERDSRLIGASKFRLIHYIVLAIDAITAFTKTPLRLIGLVGIGLFFVSIFLAIYYVVSKILYGTPLPGFTTLIVVTLALHSITFIFLGILGEYMSRIFDDSKFRPRIIIAEATSSGEPYPSVL